MLTHKTRSGLYIRLEIQFYGLVKYNYNTNQWAIYNSTNSGLPNNNISSVFIQKHVKRLVNNEFIKAGTHNVEFNGINLASGVYFYRLEAEKYSGTKKMVLI